LTHFGIWDLGILKKRSDEISNEFLTYSFLYLKKRHGRSLRDEHLLALS